MPLGHRETSQVFCHQRHLPHDTPNGPPDRIDKRKVSKKIPSLAPTTHHPWSCANLQVSRFQTIPPKLSIFFLLPPPPFPCGSAVTNIFQVVLDRLSIKKTHTLWKPQNHPTQHGCLNILSISFFLSNQQFSTKREAWSITKNTKKRMKHKPFQPCHAVRSRLWGQGWETQPTMMLVRRFGGVCVLEHSPEW